MGVLYARSGGAWVPVVGQDEVWIAADPPTDAGVELWYDTDDPGQSAATVARWEAAAYTPTLAGMVVGTGGGAQNAARYTYIGGPNVGDYGCLMAEGRILFGTTGATLPGAGAETISLPPGFDHALFIGLAPIGIAHATRMGVSTDPMMLTDQGGALIRVWAYRTDGAFPTLIDPNVTGAVPIAWAVGDAIDWCISTQVRRV